MTRFARGSAGLRTSHRALPCRKYCIVEPGATRAIDRTSVLLSTNLSAMHARQRTIYRIIGSLFELDHSAIADDLQIGDVPLWDSLGHAKLMLAVEDEFEIAISADEIADVQSIGDLETLLNRRLGVDGNA